MRRSQVLGLLTALSLALASVPAGALDGPQACLEALKVGARDEIKIGSASSLDTYVHDQFCNAVKSKQEQKSKTNLTALSAQFYGKLTDDREALSDYDHTYCRDTEGATKFDTAYSLWALTVHGKPLEDFNECMRITSPGNFPRHVEASGSCASTATIAFRPTLLVQPIAKVASFDPTNVSCTSIPSQIGPSDVAITCRHTNWDAGHLNLNTNQGAVVLDFPAPDRPAAPSKPSFAERDPTHQMLTWRRTQHNPGEIPYESANDGRDNWGTLPLPPGAVLTDVKWSCEPNLNENGHDRCDWSFADGSRTSHGKNVVEVSPGRYQWHRYWGGNQAWVTEHYDVYYTVPHVLTQEERGRLAAYEEANRAYAAMAQSGPCSAH